MLQQEEKQKPKGQKAHLFPSNSWEAPPPQLSSTLILSFKFHSGWGAYIEQGQQLPTGRSINRKNL